MKFKDQFVAVFAATDGKNHLELQRFLLAAGDDHQRYSQPVRAMFRQIAAGLRDSQVDAVSLADIGPADIAMLKYSLDHMRRCDILPLAALGHCLFALVIDEETTHKILAKKIKDQAMGLQPGDDNWTGKEFSDKLITEDARQAALKRSQAAADADNEPGDDTPNDDKPDGFDKRTA